MILTQIQYSMFESWDLPVGPKFDLKERKKERKNKKQRNFPFQIDWNGKLD